jgi:hypothetical protein
LTSPLDQYYPEFQEKRNLAVTLVNNSPISSLAEIQTYLKEKEQKEKELLHAVLFRQCMIQQGIVNLKNLPSDFVYRPI